MKGAGTARRGLGTLVALLGLGLLLGALCLAAGVLVIGMGHGWGLPFRYGCLSLFLYPWDMARWGWIDVATPWRLDAGLTALAMVPLPMVVAGEVLPHPRRGSRSGRSGSSLWRR